MEDLTTEYLESIYDDLTSEIRHKEEFGKANALAELLVLRDRQHHLGVELARRKAAEQGAGTTGKGGTIDTK